MNEHEYAKQLIRERLIPVLTVAKRYGIEITEIEMPRPMVGAYMDMKGEHLYTYTELAGIKIKP